jgi:hypothetical protein
MKRKLFALASIVTILSMFFTGTASASTPLAPKLDTLTPGQIVTFAQTVPINLVFIGYPAQKIDKTALSSWLPATYQPVVRYPQYYGLPGRDMGLKYNFTYKYVFKDKAFADLLFGYMRSIGTISGRTPYQIAYNGMASNIINVGNKILYIDAEKVETWLASNLGMSAKSYTIVFINWYGRTDFRWHVYKKANEPDPDTLYNFGALRGSRKMISWGGSESRLWFLDLSAGPEAWSGNYDVDHTDLDGDGISDYRIPPIWEYAAGGYRAPGELSSDLGMVTRFVGINLLFTPSPLYDPLASAPSFGGRKIIHINMMEDDPASDGTAWINPSFVRTAYQAFEPYYNWKVMMTDVDPIDPNARLSLRIFNGLSGDPGCWGPYGDPFGQLFCYFDSHRSMYIPAYLPMDYVAGIHAFNTTDANMGWNFGLLGFADDNWIDGTPSYVFEFGSNGYRSMGYGFTSTTIHEGGHHFGLSHPHDGYDSEWNIDYGPGGSLYFAWLGDESNTVMHYMDLTTEFGRFNKDSMGRYETAGYLNWSNELLASLMADPGYARVLTYVRAAEYNATASVTAFNGWNYILSAALAKKAYWYLEQAATILGVPTPDVNAEYRSVINSEVPHEGDPIRFPDN